MTTKAIPLCAGMALKNFFSTSTPPAEAPMATIGKPLAALLLSFLLVVASCRAFFARMAIGGMVVDSCHPPPSALVICFSDAMGGCCLETHRL